MEFQNKYKGKASRSLRSMDEDGWRSVRPFLEEKKMTYTVVVGNGTLASSYALDALPLTVLIDRDGKIAGSQAGIMDKTHSRMRYACFFGPHYRAPRIMEIDGDREAGRSPNKDSLPISSVFSFG